MCKNGPLIPQCISQLGDLRIPLVTRNSVTPIEQNPPSRAMHAGHYFHTFRYTPSEKVTVQAQKGKESTHHTTNIDPTLELW